MRHFLLKSNLMGILDEASGNQMNLITMKSIIVPPLSRPSQLRKDTLSCPRLCVPTIFLQCNVVTKDPRSEQFQVSHMVQCTPVLLIESYISALFSVKQL